MKLECNLIYLLSANTHVLKSCQCVCVCVCVCVWCVVCVECGVCGVCVWWVVCVCVPRPGSRVPCARCVVVL